MSLAKSPQATPRNGNTLSPHKVCIQDINACEKTTGDQVTDNFFPDSYDYTQGDVITDFAEANGQILRCHNLIWYNQLPSWGRLIIWFLDLTERKRQKRKKERKEKRKSKMTPY